MNAIWKLLGIGALGLLLMIPLGLVDSTVDERKMRLAEAHRTIAQRWAAPQVVGGPMLRLPVNGEERTERGVRQVRRDRSLLPSSLEISGSMSVETRYYGIYELPVFVADLELRGQFLAADIAEALGTDSLAGPIRTEFPIADVRGVRGDGMIDWNGAPIELAAAEFPVHALSALAATPDIDPNQDQTFHLRLRLAGTGSLMFLPLGKRTRVDIQGPWPDPSFSGAYLPDQRTVSEQGFDARWEVLGLNRGFGQIWSDDIDWSSRLNQAGFGVALYQPAGIYQRSERSIKYGVLFIALTFLGYFIFETLAGVRLHPVQYAFLGLAMACFYLLLLALSEHLGFGLAYAIGVTALCLLCGGYSAAILGRRRHGWTAAVLLAGVYGLLYVLVIGRDYSLLVGSAALFAMLAIAMMLTRHVNWYEVQVGPRRPGTGQRASAQA